MTDTDTDGGAGPLEVLLDTLDLETIDRDLFRGKTPPTYLQRIFGGQVAGQALVAAQRTVPDRPVHSLHAYFLRPGDPNRPVVYEVDRIRDGRSYATRRVVGVQAGKAIFNLQASFHHPEPGYDWQIPYPGLDAAGEPIDPAGLPRWRSRNQPQEHDDRPGPGVPFDIRVAPAGDGWPRRLWIRTVGPLPDSDTLHRCVAAYASDLTLLAAAAEAAGAIERPPSFVASLDHAMWFHRPFRVDQWMCYAQSSPSAGDGRGLSLGQLFASDGTLAITVVQEGALRPGRTIGSEGPSDLRRET